MILTQNEKRVLRHIATSPGRDYSINQIAHSCAITPQGAYKILTKLEKEGIVKATPIANIKSYGLDFKNEKTSRVLELAFMTDKIEGGIKMRADDLDALKEVALACVMFGSYITPKKEPSDLDVLFVLEKKKFELYKKTLTRVQDRTPLKIQDVVQTKEDLEKNLETGGAVITSALRNGIVLWGFDVICQVIKNAHVRKS